ncbi:microneme protein MIC16 [Toxoplasma gondii GT1]|uniref:Micronemal protein 16 n=2 Tax=Toxoplasma gondii TaxID=5811 RepID=B3VQI5_TOXGO|nr:micronemal protein 16 [Toxoplasma gondii]APY27303.1 micronemal protein 16 [Toxoplasma gondii]EPR59726.1 microneme protein MIC16 [Toxoplasma gondii GT1]KAF4644444.1 microneme protein MIC16 [Toxoplasma gondii]
MVVSCLCTAMSSALSQRNCILITCRLGRQRSRPPDAMKVYAPVFTCRRQFLYEKYTRRRCTTLGGLVALCVIFTAEAISRSQHPYGTSRSDLSPPATVDSTSYGMSILEAGGPSDEVAIPSDRLQTFRNASLDFDRAIRFPNQASVAESRQLRLMQMGECQNVYWGKKELISRITGKWKSALHPSCHESWFTYTSWSRTKTWRECAQALDNSYLYFSWVRRHNEADGACIWVKPSRSDVSRSDVEDCLVDVNPQKEVAVTGIVGSHHGCTTCEVGEWSETTCDSWCNDGVKGRFRELTGHTNSAHCSTSADANCDVCPNLWEVQRCSTAVECAQGIKPRVRFCPNEGREYTAEGWRACAERCQRKFNATNGDTANRDTFYKAECFRYSFNNDTSACILNPLHACPDAESASDVLWISGDVLSMPSADYTTVTWQEWQSWSSCSEVDPATGWKKRTRRPKTWGYRPDNVLSPLQWISVTPCASNVTLTRSELDLAMNPSAMCWVYSDFADWSTVSCEPRCGADRKKTRARAVRQMPVVQPDGRISESCASSEVSLEARQQTKDCPGFVSCGTGCVFGEWTAWSDCRCTAEGSTARTIRARELVSGSKESCSGLEEERKCEKVCEESIFSNGVTYAVAGGIGLVVVIGLGFIGRKFYRALPAERTRDNYL